MAKRRTADMQAVDVRKMQRDGLLKPGQSFVLSWTHNGVTTTTISVHAQSDSVTLTYRHRDRGGEWQDMRYPVRLTWTPCNYGGQRAWWCCPALGCGRRVALLFGGAVFACRHCQRLAYKSQNETTGDRAFRRANNLRAKMGWVKGVIYGAGDKPKGMHWKTYWRLRASHDAHVMQALGGSAARMNKAMARLHRIN
jgi:hypothetical protein